jgi:hypothetical protein
MQHFRGSSRRRAVAFESVADAHDWIAVPPATRYPFAMAVRALRHLNSPKASSAEVPEVPEAAEEMAVDLVTCCGGPPQGLSWPVAGGCPPRRRIVPGVAGGSVAGV